MYIFIFAEMLTANILFFSCILSCFFFVTFVVHICVFVCMDQLTHMDQITFVCRVLFHFSDLLKHAVFSAGGEI